MYFYELTSSFSCLRLVGEERVSREKQTSLSDRYRSSDKYEERYRLTGLNPGTEGDLVRDILPVPNQVTLDRRPPCGSTYWSQSLESRSS